MATPFQTNYIFPNGKRAKNRLSLAPMTNCQSNDDGTLGLPEKKWLIQNAEGGFGIVMTCASYITPTGKAWAGQLGIHDDLVIPGLQDLTKTLKARDSISIIQIFHGGVRCPSKITGQQPVSASEFDLPIPNFEKPRALTIAEIEEIIDLYAQAAERAYKAGFDGVEIHGANGYLITQFISTQTNLRTDRYGGSLENRARFARQILQACRAKVPADFLVGIRLSPENSRMQVGLDLDENIQIAQWLVEDGADFIDLSIWDFFAPSLKYPDQAKPVAVFFREKLGETPIIAGGGIKTPTQAEKALEMGTDFVALGTIAIGNTNWPEQALMDKNYSPIIPPYTVSYLQQHGISERFINYIRHLPREIVTR